MQNKEHVFISPISKEELTQKLLKIGVKQNYLDLHLDKYFYVIDRIFSNEAFHKSDQNITTIRSKILIEKFGRRYYDAVINQLKYLNIIKKVRNHANFKRLKKSSGYVLLNVENFNIVPAIDQSSDFIINKCKFNPKQETDTPLKERLFRTMNKLKVESMNFNQLSTRDKIFLYCFENRQFQKQGETGGRIFNNFTNISKNIRKHFTLNNEKLFFVDIVNSQMVFFANVIINNLDAKQIQPDEKTLEFQSMAANGKLYEFIMKRLSVKRPEAKNITFKLIFGKYDSKNPLKEIFINEFQQLMNENRLIKKYDHHIMAQQMQQLEAEVVFDAVNYIPFDKDVLTIHDSLFSSILDKDIIINALIRSFNARGIQATININDEYKINTDTPVEHKINDNTVATPKETTPIGLIQDEKIEPVKQSVKVKKEISSELIEMEEKKLIDYLVKKHDKTYANSISDKFLYRYFYDLNNNLKDIQDQKKATDIDIENVRKFFFEKVILSKSPSSKFIKFMSQHEEAKEVLNTLLAYKMDHRNKPN